jgi:hypothetical protein
MPANYNPEQMMGARAMTPANNTIDQELAVAKSDNELTEAELALVSGGLFGMVRQALGLDPPPYHAPPPCIKCGAG